MKSFVQRVCVTVGFCACQGKTHSGWGRCSSLVLSVVCRRCKRARERGEGEGGRDKQTTKHKPREASQNERDEHGGRKNKDINKTALLFKHLVVAGRFGAACSRRRVA